MLTLKTPSFTDYQPPKIILLLLFENSIRGILIDNGFCWQTRGCVINALVIRRRLSVVALAHRLLFLFLAYSRVADVGMMRSLLSPLSRVLPRQGAAGRNLPDVLSLLPLTALPRSFSVLSGKAGRQPICIVFSGIRRSVADGCAAPRCWRQSAGCRARHSTGCHTTKSGCPPVR